MSDKQICPMMSRPKTLPKEYCDNNWLTPEMELDDGKCYDGIVYCQKDKCMAWRPERTFNDTIETAPSGNIVIKKAGFPGFCKLIERG